MMCKPCEHPTWTEYPMPQTSWLKALPDLVYRKITDPPFKHVRICNHCHREF